MPVLKQINCGNSYPVAGWESDASYLTSGTQIYNDDGTPVAQDTSGVDCPEEVLQDHRWALSGEDPLAYSIGGLGAYSTVDVTLYWSEIFYDASGLRRFNVDVQGVNKETNYDVWVQAGNADNTGISQTYTVAPSAGTVTIEVFRVTAAPMLSGIKITGNNAPACSITSPADSATVSGTVTIEATATDDSAVSGVEFFVDGVSIGTDSTPSGSTYSINWDTTGYSNAAHTLKATATDDESAATDDTISVTVNNAVPDTLQWTVNVKWDGLSFVDEGDRLMGISVDRGRPRMLRQGGGWERMKVGRCTLTLDNYDGRYDAWNVSSPLYPDVVPSPEVQVQVVSGSTTYDVFRGYALEPETYDYREPKLRLTVEDGWRLLQEAEAYTAVQDNVRVGGAIQDVLNEVVYPWGSDLDADGTNISNWWAHGNAADNLYDLMAYDGGFVAIKANGDVLFRSRLGDYKAAVDDTFTQDELLRDMSLGQPLDNIRNVIRAQVYPPSAVGVQTGVTFWEYGNTLYIGPGETSEVYAEWDLPAYNVTPPVAGTDYVFTAGSANLTVTLDAAARQAVLSLENTGSSGGYVTVLQLRGDVLDFVGPIQVQAENTASQTAYGKRLFEMDVRHSQSVPGAQAFVEWLATWLANPTAAPRVNVVARPDIQFARELGDRVRLDLDRVGLDKNYRIGHISLRSLDPNCASVQTTFTLEPVDLFEDYWVWDVSAWDVSTYWAPF